jgi:DNA-binding SARP family transcriptional activator
VLEIRCFGRFEVYRDGTPVRQWRRDRARAVLKYLVVQRRPVAREQMLKLLWADTDPALSARSLRVVLHALRQAVGTWDEHGVKRDYVVVETDQLLINPSAPLWIDIDAFMDHVRAADALDRDDRGLAAAEYAQAEAIYRDDYLTEDLTEPWTRLRREELKDRYLVVLARLADHFLDSGDTAECIARCHKLLAQDACREDAYERLMYCHALLGQRSRALHWFDICETTLRNELGVRPGERIYQMYDQIASNDNVAPGVAAVSLNGHIAPWASSGETH